MKIMNFKKICILFFICFYINSNEVSFYSAKYNFQSDDFSVTGVREFLTNENGHELKFNASNLIATLSFSSKFDLENEEVISKNYDINIKPKFLNRDQTVTFNNESKTVSSVGRNTWTSNIENSINLLDPLNAQIMIRSNISKGIGSFELNIINMRKGGFEQYLFNLIATEKCEFDGKEYQCHIVERTNQDSKRVINYFIIKELGYIFLKITDEEEGVINKLELKELLSLG